jgi:hypothetical protein
MVTDSSQDLKPAELELRLDLLGPSAYSIASPMNSRTEFSNLNTSLVDQSRNYQEKQMLLTQDIMEEVKMYGID